MSGMTKTERTELRSIIRQQFKVLRHEVVQRQYELMAEAQETVAEKFKDTDEKWDQTLDLIREAMREANRRVNDVLYEQGYQQKGSTERIWVGDLPDAFGYRGRGDIKPEDNRQDLMRRAKAQIDAQVKAAELRLDRDETDLLRDLAIGALESEDARAFMGRIPTVGELVSSARIAELEKAIEVEE